MSFERLLLSSSLYFLRVDTHLYQDDPDEKECYSLCKYIGVNYKREEVYRGPKEWAIQQAEEYIKNVKPDNS